MSRFLLDDATLKEIAKKEPIFDDLSEIVLNLAPDLISIQFPIDSDIPVAAVCLHDVIDALYKIRIGLSECYQHEIWFREKKEPPNDTLATVFMEFYIDSVASKLYAAGEHLANALIFMLETSDDQLKKYKKVSQWSTVGNFLKSELGEHPITQSALSFVSKGDWDKVMLFRNSSVHDKPPTIKGLGIVYKRKKRWRRSEDGKTAKLGIGGGDKPDYSIDEVVEFTHSAVTEFIELFRDVVGFYVDILEKQKNKISSS